MPPSLTRPALALLAAVILICGSSLRAQERQAPIAPSMFFTTAQWERQGDFEQALNAIPDPQRLRAWHDLLASEPHIAGTEGDQRVIDALEHSFREMGLEVEIHEFWALLCEPVDAKLEIIASGDAHEQADASSGNRGAADGASSAAGVAAPLADAPRRGVVALPIREDDLLNDPSLAHPGLSFGWNAYSGSGDVTAGVVYVNYGTREDFEALRARGIDCTGKIVLARYGGNYRGFKAKYAEAAGAIGLVIFTDPDDSGYRKGVPYPEGGWANDTCIQRGSIVTLDQPGDPLTPGEPATEHARRIDPDAIDLPRIPVQPIGYRAAQQIMQRMTGEALPAELVKTWQGGLPCAYRLTGGDQLQLRLMVQQRRVIKRSANVLARLPGERWPDQQVIIGSHHDAWGFGAGDPTAGTILVMEAARSFAALAQQGLRPQRSIVFACWGAEEFGIIGSTEYCEQYRDALRASTLAYINLDGAAMGPNFSASSDPLLKTLIEDAARDVPQARQPARSVYDAWRGERAAPEIGNLGGGSDHIGFYCHLGIPSCFISSGGAPGTAYHSNYDNLAWYRHTIGEDYEPALMLTRVVNIVAARLANAPIPPLDATRYAKDLRQHTSALAERIDARTMAVDLQPLRLAIDDLERAAIGLDGAQRAALQQAEAGAPARIEALAAELKREPMAFIWQPRWPAGMPGREWFTNYYASSDPHAGYASWMLPALRGPVDQGDEAAARQAADEYTRIVQRLRDRLQALRELAKAAD